MSPAELAAVLQGISASEILRRVGRRKMPCVSANDPSRPFVLTVDPVALAAHMRSESYRLDFGPARSFNDLLNP